MNRQTNTINDSISNDAKENHWNAGMTRTSLLKTKEIYFNFENKNCKNTMKQLELLNDFTEVIVTVYDGCSTLINLKRTGNTLHNKDHSISIDMEKLTLKGRTAKGVFKSLMNQVISIIWDEYPESDEADKLMWALDEEYKIFVHYNCQMRDPYSYKDSL